MKALIYIVSTIEQIFYMSSAVYLIEYKQWNAWTLALAVLLCIAAQPSNMLKIFGVK